MTEVSRLNGIHSWRVVGDNSHKKSGTPIDFRKEIGLLANYVKEQGAYCHFLQIQDPDMPIYSEALGLRCPEEFEFKPYSKLVDPNLPFKSLKNQI